MNKIINIILIVSFLPTLAFGQLLRLSYEPGFGLYGMRNLKNIQQDMVHNNSLPMRVVEDFPGYINHLVSVNYYLDENTLLGINASYMTTGGRTHLSDYSGEYKLDMVLNGFQFGIESEYNFILNNKLFLFTNFKMGLVSSKLKLTETLMLLDINTQTNNDSISQINYFLEPNAGLSYNVSKRISVRLTVGFNVDTSIISKKFIDWTGIRTRAGFSYQF
jgi:hypothetical protein